MGPGIAAYRQQRQSLDERTVGARGAGGAVAARGIDDPHGRTPVAQRLEVQSGKRRRHQTLARKHVGPARVVHRNQGEMVEKQCLFQFIRHAQLVAAVVRAQLITTDADELLRVGRVVDPGRELVAHLAATEEVGDELETVAVPRVEDRDTTTASGIEFDYLEHPGLHGRGGNRLGLDNPGRPQDADDVDCRAGADAEQQVRRCRRR